MGSKARAVAIPMGVSSSWACLQMRDSPNLVFACHPKWPWFSSPNDSRTQQKSVTGGSTLKKIGHKEKRPTFKKYNNNNNNNNNNIGRTHKKEPRQNSVRRSPGPRMSPDVHRGNVTGEELRSGLYDLGFKLSEAPKNARRRGDGATGRWSEVVSPKTRGAAKQPGVS